MTRLHWDDKHRAIRSAPPQPSLLRQGSMLAPTILLCLGVLLVEPAIRGQAVAASDGLATPGSRPSTVLATVQGTPAPGPDPMVEIEAIAPGQPITLLLPLVLEPMQAYLPMIQTALHLAALHPQDRAQRQSPNTFLAWTWGNDDARQATFTLFLEANDPTPDAIVARGLVQTQYAPGPLALNTSYYWQVEARLPDGGPLRSPIWSFQTEGRSTAPQVGATVTVPAGEFRMGCDRANTGGFTCEEREFPLHRVWLDAYAIDKYEVTNGEYRGCVSAGACRLPLLESSNKRDNYYANPTFRDYPVLYVSWWDAQNYCAWVGKRLPTEAEWEKAARGPIDTRPYPWGSTFTPDCTHANRAAPQSGGTQCDNDPMRVGSFPLGASAYGAMDMSGNVFEWVTDYFDSNYYPYSPYMNPVNETIGSELLFVIRGGSYRDNYQYLRTTHRHFGHWGPTRPNEDVPYYRSSRLGFRCARSLPKP